MKCNVCGRQPLNQEANFCDYCGASFREQAHAINQTAVNAPAFNKPIMETVNPFQRSNHMVQSEQHRKEQHRKEQEITFGNWFSIYLLLLIPIVGWIAFIVLLFVWAFDNKTPASKKNWARVTLIFIGILIVVFLSYLIELLNTPAFQDYVNKMYQSLY